MALTTGCNHVTIITENMDRLVRFYREVFDASVRWDVLEDDGIRHTLIDLGGGFALHPFEFADGNPHGRGSAAMFDRGHIDHIALNVADASVFEELRQRLVEHGASDGAVTDFGVSRNVWFEDPDGHGSEIALWVDGQPRKFQERIVETYEQTPAATSPMRLS